MPRNRFYHLARLLHPELFSPPPPRLSCPTVISRLFLFNYCHVIAVASEVMLADRGRLLSLGNRVE